MLNTSSANWIIAVYNAWPNFKKKQNREMHISLSSHSRTHISNILSELTIFPPSYVILHFQPVEVVSRCRESQLQLGETYSRFVLFKTKHLQSEMCNIHFIRNYCDLISY